MRRAALLPLGGALAALAAVAAPFGADADGLGFARLCLGGLAMACLWAGFAGARRADTVAVAALAALAGVALLRLLSGGLENTAGPGYALALVAVWLSAWHVVDAATAAPPRDSRLASAANLVAPVVFGLTVLLLWEGVVRGFGSSMMKVILPAPSAIAARFGSSLPTLAADFAQTFQGVSVGYALGCGSGILVAILIDRVPFLQRGLLPLGNLVSALPIVGMAPIMVMWFGFDWQSKAAIVVIMTFFPQLVNTVAGLASAGRMERDLMKTYAASYGQTLAALRLPSALPFIFNGLKINSTLALIGAIVAEFFGTPIVGMGFRINTEVGRMNIDMVWATILVAALTGSLFYGLLTLVERRVTFWHASYRQRTT